MALSTYNLGPSGAPLSPTEMDWLKVANGVPTPMSPGLEGLANPTQPAAAPAPAPAPTGPTSAQIAQQQKADQDAAAARAINAGFDGVNAVYDRQLADIPTLVDSAGNIITVGYNAQKGAIDSGYNRGTEHLNYARGDLGEKTKRSIGDLSNSIRQSFDSFSTLIGARGAADSSANGQLSYALQKVNAQGRTDIARNQQDQLGQIALKQGDLDAEHTTALTTLEAWKTTQLEAIHTQFLQMQRTIELAKAGADKDKLLALASLSTDLVNAAIAATSGVEATVAAQSKAITDSVTKATAPGDPSKLAAVDFSPTASAPAAAPTFSVSAGAPAIGDSFSDAVPYYKRLQPQAV